MTRRKKHTPTDATAEPATAPSATAPTTDSEVSGAAPQGAPAPGAAPGTASPLTAVPTPLAGPASPGNLRMPLTVFFIVFATYAIVSGNRLKVPSQNTHFVYLADSLLHGQLSNVRPPPHQEDWARVETLTLKDGRVLKGAYLKDGFRNRFRTLKREVSVIEPSQIASKSVTVYVSFPPFPAVLMMPFVALFKYRFNDVFFTVIMAAFNAMLAFMVLARLRELGYSRRSQADDLWLVAAFAFGSVHFFASVRGEVWFTAQIVGFGLACLYVLAALEAKQPLWAGVALALAFATRPQYLYAFPFLVAESLRTNLGAPLADNDARLESWRSLAAAPLRWLARLFAGGDPVSLLARLRWGRFLKQMVLFALPFIAVGVLLMAMNYARFGRPTEFGHTYLDVRWTARIQKFGLFNYAFLSKNLAASLVLLPKILSSYPYVKIPWHGMSIFVTTPILLYLVWPKERPVLHRGLWLSLAAVAISDLLYQNTGWVQFGYRFMIDWSIFAFALLALGGRPLNRQAKILIVIGIAVNLFGAITFNQHPFHARYYFDGFFPSE